eukprot:s669_g8.t1
MSAVQSQTCSRCNGHGHQAAQCPKMPFYKTCEYCKMVGHRVKACPVLQRKAQEKGLVLEFVEIREGVVAAARREEGQVEDGMVREWHPEHWVLSEDEEREARKLEKKLREIAALEQLVEQGQGLDSLQLQKVDRKNEIEAHEVLRKVRLGYHRINLPAVS